MMLCVRNKNCYNYKTILLHIITLNILLQSIQSSNIFSPLINNSSSINPYNVLYPNTTLHNLNEYSYVQGPCLNNFNCFLPYGVCLNTTTCMCMPDFAHIYIPGHSIQELSCSYRRKKAVVAALLELFLPLGLGHFYVGHYTLGTIKFFYNFFLYIFCCFLYYKGTNNEVLSNMICLCVVMSCVIPMWNIVDLFLFFTDFYKDGYGIPLA
jgi:TM2 domain-containing membrane protein YozV